MRNYLILVGIFLMSAFQGQAQVIQNTNRVDSMGAEPYVNVGKIAARKAAIQSAILPGLGQISNKVTVWSVGKVGLIYGGAAALTLSYIDNTKYYNIFLDELRYRQAHGGQPDPNSIYAAYPTQSLITAKDVYRRNREVIIFSYVGLYAINIIDAYVSARLKYFDVDDNLALKITPTVINPDRMFAHQITPALKLSLKL